MVKCLPGGFSESELTKYFIKQSYSHKKNNSIILPPGDDAFVGKLGTQKIVITTDILTENTDFNLSWYLPKSIFPKLNFYQLGTKLARINLSDLFSMGDVKPLWTVGNFTLNNKLLKSDVIKIFHGVKNELAKYGCIIIGGDISRGKELSFSLTLVGILKSEQPITRTGFSISDYLCVTGTLGDSFAGLKIINSQSTIQNYSLSSKFLITRHLLPQLRNTIVKPILPIITSMTDISDGLYKSLEIIVNSKNNVAVEIDTDNIPVSKHLKLFCKEQKIDYKQIAIIGGEDYELLFTVKKEDISKVFNLKNVTVIGKIVNHKKGSPKIVFKNFYNHKDLFGFDHFAQRASRV